jgi:hypothetical protein
MLLLAYLITRSDQWGEAKIRVLAANYDDESQKNIEELQQTLEEVRIEAESLIVVKADADSIVGHSAESALVFLPFRLRGNQLSDPFGGSLEDMVSGLPTAALVLAAKDIDLDAEPEEGQAGELAAALDAFTEAEKKAQEAEKEALKAAEEAQEKLQELKAATESGTDEEDRSKVEAAVLEAEEQAIKSARRAAKASAKVEDAARTLEALGAKPDKESNDSGE